MRIQACPSRLLLICVLVVLAGEANAQSTSSSSFGQQNQLSNTGQVQNQTQGQTGFSGQNRVQQQNITGQQQNTGQQQFGGNDGFIGSDADQRRNQQQAQNPRQQRRNLFNFAIESLNDLRESRRERRANQNAAPPVRVKLKPLFRVVQPSKVELTTQVRSQLSKSLPQSVASAPQVSVNEGIATLQGQVANDYDRQLLAKMVSLQPGISQVDNQITIDQPGLGQPLLVAPPQ